MPKTKGELFDTIIKSLETYFDIKKDMVVQGIPVAAEAAYHSRSEKYVLMKKARIWAAEANETMFLVLADQLDESFYDQCVRALWKEGISRIKPHKEHMYTYVTLVFLTDSAAGEVKRKVRKTSGHKDFLFSLYGWSDLRIAVKDMEDGSVQTNRMGRELIKMLAAAEK